MNSRAFWIIVVIGIAAGALFLPVTQYRVVSYGIDSYDTHTPIFSKHIAAEEFTTTSKTIGIGAILVNLFHAKQLSNVDIKIINNETHLLIATQTIPSTSIHDDSFAYANIPNNPIPASTSLRIEFSAPDSTIKNPIGVRYGKDSQALALAVIERVPLWKAILTVAHNRQQDWEYIGVGALFALIIAMPAILFPKKPLFAWISLAVICLASYITMLSIIPQFGGVSGGDPYDYLSIAKSIQHGHNPFLNTKRLPGYPLLLVPTVASEKFDDQFVMRIVTSTAGIVGVLLIALIAQTLTNSWPVSLAAAVILAFQKDYIWTAMRPEPYAVYTALLLLALYFFLLCYKKQSQFLYIAFGLSLGYAAMTRQEGFVLAVVLGICSLLYEIARGKNISRFFLMYLPAFAVILPFFITNAVIYHNPFYIKYLEDDRLQIVNSFLAFQDALGATWGIIGSMWKTSWDQLERLNVNSAPLMAGIIGLWGWYSFNRFNKKKTAQRIITGLLLITILFIVLASVYLKSVFSGTFTQISAGFVLASIPIFLIETKWKGLVILLVALSQIGIATWFHPFPKHYEQSYPIIIAMISTALLARVPKRGLFTYSSLVVAILPFLLIGTMLGQKLNTTIDKQNANTALDSVTYRAARYARALPQPIGFDQAYLPARFYFDPDAKYFPPEDNPTPKMEQDWLAKNPLKTIVVTNAEKIFQNPYPNWTLIKTFKAAGDDDKIFESWIYSVH